MLDQRLSKTADGKLRVKLKSPFSDGTSSIILTPMELLERLVAIVPPPNKNMIRYSGVFASNSRLRKQIVPAAAPPEPKPSQFVNEQRLQPRNLGLAVREATASKSEFGG